MMLQNLATACERIPRSLSVNRQELMQSVWLTHYVHKMYYPDIKMQTRQNSSYIKEKCTKHN
jgi:hypothetical protein